MNNRETGSIKWFDSEKGYGSILTEDNEEIFLQLRSISGERFVEYVEGQKVSFEVHTTKSGKEARNVQSI